MKGSCMDCGNESAEDNVPCEWCGYPNPINRTLLGGWCITALRKMHEDAGTYKEIVNPLDIYPFITEPREIISKEIREERNKKLVKKIYIESVINELVYSEDNV